MKILLINNYHFRRGGADVVYLNTYELLKSKGHDVFCFSSINNKNVKKGVNPYFTKKIDFFNISFFQKFFRFFRFFYSKNTRSDLKNLLKKNHFDVVHIHTYKGMLTTSILLEIKKNNIPIIFTAHDYGLIDPHNALLDGNFEITENTIHKSAFYTVIDKANRNNYIYSFVSYLEYIFNNLLFSFDKNFKKVIFVSKFSLMKHIECSRFNFNSVHLYNFFPLIDHVKPNNEKGDYFLFYGRLSKEKGILTLIEAWKKAKIQSELWIVGNSDASLNKDFTIKRDKNIKILGFKQGEELFQIIKNCSFVLVPSECYENNPLTIIESYCFGKPVIGSRIGGIPEIIIDDKTGFTFEMKNVKELSNLILKASKIKTERYKFMSFNAREFAEANFSSNTHYKKLIKIYKNAINDY